MLDVYHVIVHVKVVYLIQVLVQVVKLELDSYKLLDLNKLVLDNVLMELIPKIMFVKFVILNA